MVNAKCIFKPLIIHGGPTLWDAHLEYDLHFMVKLSFGVGLGWLYFSEYIFSLFSLLSDYIMNVLYHGKLMFVHRDLVR